MERLHKRAAVVPVFSRPCFLWIGRGDASLPGPESRSGIRHLLPGPCLPALLAMLGVELQTSLPCGDDELEPVLNTPSSGWTALQREQGHDFLRWLHDGQALRAGFGSLGNALWALLEICVQTREDALKLWAAVPDVMTRCNDRETYCKPGAAPAYAWIHLLDRYVRTWLALERLAEQCLLPMGTRGVSTLDVGTGPGPSAFATHDFYTAMVDYAEAAGNERWRQPPRMTPVESSVAMNHFREHLASILWVQGAPESVVAMSVQLAEFRSIHPARDRAELFERLRADYDQYYDEYMGEGDSQPRYSSEEANYIANTHHRYRLFTFSHFLTEPSTVVDSRADLLELLTDSQPGSVVLVIGGIGRYYPNIYREVASIAREAGFSRRAEGIRVSCSDVNMADLVYAEGVRFFRRLKHIGGALPVRNKQAGKVVDHFEGTKRIPTPVSAVHAYRKVYRTRIR